MSSLERKILLYFGDVVMAVGSMLLIVNLRDLGPSQKQPQVLVTVGWSALVVVVVSLLGPAIDAYNLRTAARATSGVKLGLRTGLAVSVGYLVIPYITPSLLSSRQTALMFTLTVTAATAAWRLCYALLFGAPRVHRLAVIGSGPSTMALKERLIDSHHPAYSVVTLGGEGSDRSSDTEASAAALRGLLAEGLVDEIVVEDDDSALLNDETLQAVLDANEAGLAVSSTLELYERLTGRLPLEYLGSSHEVLKVLLPLKRAQQPAWSRAGKRLIDIGFGLVALLLTGLLVPFVWIANLFSGNGPLFYRQERVGLAGSPFELVKFRTMVVDAEADGPRWSTPNDTRVTRMGRVLRRLHIDELPQGLNMLKGQMSLVGPRPERPAMVEKLSAAIPYYTARHAVLPGLTGWAQVNHQYVSTNEGALVRLEYDLYYVKHMSVMFDLSIFASTLAGLGQEPDEQDPALQP